MRTPDAMEPYDAMATRFERALEAVSHPLLKSVEILETGAVGESLRDRLNFAAKLGLVTDVEIWMEMRAARNRIAHDYLPQRVKAVQDLLRTRYRVAFEDFRSQFDQYIAKKGIQP
jgi:hypothetical protein